MKAASDLDRRTPDRASAAARQATRRSFSEAALDPDEYTFGVPSIILVGDFGQLEAAARVILDRESTHRAALFFLAAGLFGQARYSESILQFQRRVTEYPHFGPGYLQLANSLQVSGRLAEAVQAYQALLDSGADRESKTFGRTRLGQLRERSR